MLDSWTALMSTSKAVAPTNYKLLRAEPVQGRERLESATPKDLTRVVVVVIMEEVDKAINPSYELNSIDPRTLVTIWDCRELLDYGMDDLKVKIFAINDQNIENLSSATNDIKTWLSATITYQENCGNDFPTGKMKTNMRAALTDTKQMTNNALSIVDKVVSLFQMLESSSDIINRRLEESYYIEIDTIFDDEDEP